MLDTNTCIYAMKRVEGFETRLPLHDCGISIIVLGELEWGARLSVRMEQSLAAVRDFVGAIQVIDMDAATARQYGRLRAHLRSIGQPIGPNDLWGPLPATCLDHAQPLRVCRACPLKPGTEAA